MAITILSFSETKIPGGQSGFMEVRGIGTWADTNTTGTMPVRLKHITSIQLTAGDTAEPMYVVTSTGVITQSNDAITIGRLTGGANPMYFSFRYTGY
jgi:hypothetical protein